MLLLRAIVAFLILPGTVAFLVPILLVAEGRNRGEFGLSGILVLTLGAALLLWCVWTFYAEGRGTLAPWAPPRKLVEAGPYRFSRNPMYLSVLLVLCGWWLGSRSWPLLVYAGAVAVAFHLRVVYVEEPRLKRAHPGDWDRYRRRVPRWVLASLFHR
jgi:protein-S-isoprenylcysteine O-methyltransferase Ste14